MLVQGIKKGRLLPGKTAQAVRAFTGTGSHPLDSQDMVVPPRPRGWKAIVVTFCVALPVMEGLTRGLVPTLGPMHWLVRDVLVVALMGSVLTFMLPPIHRRLGPWLSR